MDKIIVYAFVFLCIGCTSTKNEYVIKVKDVKRVQENILKEEKILKKISTLNHYENTYPQYDSDSKYIYITYSNINYNANDSILEGRYNPNSQRIDTLKHIDNLSNDDIIELKRSIYYLQTEGITGNEYLSNEFIVRKENNEIISSDKCPFFVYPYNVKDWMIENPEKMGYVVVLNKSQVKSKCFVDNYTIQDKKDNLYIITKKL